MNYKAPDLRQHPPRSPRVRLGGFVMLARMIDKGRATIAKKNGEYHYNCPLDQRLLQFVGLSAEALKKELAAGRSDQQILNWIGKNAKNKRELIDVLAWSAYQEQRTPSDPEGREFFNSIHAKVAAKREDIHTWFDLLDLDDFVSFGGQP